MRRLEVCAKPFFGLHGAVGAFWASTAPAASTRNGAVIDDASRVRGGAHESGGDCHQAGIEGELPDNGTAHQMPSASRTPLERFTVERISDHGDLRSIQDSRHNLEAAGDVIRLFHRGWTRARSNHGLGTICSQCIGGSA